MIIHEVENMQENLKVINLPLPNIEDVEDSKSQQENSANI